MVEKYVIKKILCNCIYNIEALSIFFSVLTCLGLSSWMTNDFEVDVDVEV